jgi:hypothetical protein
MMISWLVFIKHCEIFHAIIYLNWNRELERLVSRPMSQSKDFNIKLNWALVSFCCPCLLILLRHLFAKLQVIHHSLNSVGNCSSAINFEFCNNGSLIIDTFRSFTEESPSQKVFERGYENILVREIGEKLHYLFKVGLKLVCWHLKSILSQNVVRICTEHLSNSKRLGSHFEVNERFKSRCSLDGEIRIVKEAVIEDVTKLILHSDQLFNNLTVLQNFFDPERLSLRSVKLNLLEHSEAFRSDKFLEPHSNCL